MPATSSRPAVHATGLRKSYGDHTVLDGIDLSVPEGTVFCLLGPNGAGNAMIGLLLLPFRSSAFVPTQTMPGWLQAFTANQPMTPIGETMRGLLIGTHIGDSGVLAMVWLASSKQSNT